MNWGASGIETAIWILALAVWSVMIGVNVWSHKKTKSDIRWFGVNQTFYRIFTNNIWVRESDTSAVRTRDPAATARLVRLILKKRRLLKDILFLSGLFLMAMAFGRPQWGSHQEPVFQRGIDMVLLLDTSESMKAEDMAPNRLAKAQSIIDSLLDRLPGSRVALVGFASTTRLHCPLTLDFRGLKSILMNSLSYGIGTDIEKAIETSIQVLNSSESRSKVILILSDGEDHTGDIDKAVSEASKAGIRIFCIGIGTPEGGPIPEDAGSKEKGYKKHQGEIVWTRMIEDTLRMISQKTGGLYFRSTAAETEVDMVARAIQNLEKTEFSQTVTTRREDRFGFFLIGAFLLLAIDTALGDYRRTAVREND